MSGAVLFFAPKQDLTVHDTIGKLGVHVSVVSTGPLDHRASGLANLMPQHAGESFDLEFILSSFDNPEL